jgi:hypothetical protein
MHSLTHFLNNSFKVALWRRVMLVLLATVWVSPLYADTQLRMVLNWSYQGRRRGSSWRKSAAILQKRD